MPGIGTFETCRRSLRTSVRRGGPEVIGGRSKRREWTRSGHAAQADLSNECSLLNPLRRRRMNLSGRDVFQRGHRVAHLRRATRPQHYAGLRTGLGQSWSHPFSCRRCRARVDLAHTLGFGDRCPGIRISVWGRWHPLRPHTSWVGRLLAGELTPKLAAEALQGLGTPGRALRDH